ncbi:MAG: DUF389 domain-containing protein [Planctomycetota bacterium]
MIVLIHSEKNLRTALDLLKHTLDHCDSGVHVLVIGSDRKVFCKVAQKQITESCPNQAVTVSAIESDAETILAHIEKQAKQPVMLVGGTQDRSLTAALFEGLGNRTLWLQGTGGEPPSRIHEVSVNGNRLPRDASERFFRARSRYPVDVCWHPDAEDVSSLPDQTTLDDLLAGRLGDRELDGGDLLIFPLDDPEPKDRVYRRIMRGFDEQPRFALALVHDGDDVIEGFITWIRRKWEAVAPLMKREQRLELAEQLRTNSDFNLEFLGLISASAILAAFGLVQNSAAVIIGAMLIAPLMTPLMGAGLAIAQGNRPLLRTAMLTVVCGFLGAMVASFLFGLLFFLLDSDGMQDRSELMARTRPSTIDFGVALVGGLAASYARTRTHLSAALAGAAIAAALVPPIATAGLLLAMQLLGVPGDWPSAVGPVLLVSINILMIVIGSSFVLWSRGMSGDVKSGKHQKKIVRVIAALSVLGAAILLWTYRRNHPDMFKPVLEPAIRETTGGVDSTFNPDTALVAHRTRRCGGHAGMANGCAPDRFSKAEFPH